VSDESDNNLPDLSSNKDSEMSVMLCYYRVSDEKDARSYLQALAAKMTDELDSLKMSGTPTPVSRSLDFLQRVFVCFSHVWNFQTCTGIMLMLAVVGMSRCPNSNVVEFP